MSPGVHWARSRGSAKATLHPVAESLPDLDPEDLRRHLLEVADAVLEVENMAGDVPPGVPRRFILEGVVDELVRARMQRFGIAVCYGSLYCGHPVVPGSKEPLCEGHRGWFS